MIINKIEVAQSKRQRFDKKVQPQSTVKNEFPRK